MVLMGDDMRVMLILLGASLAAYFLSGIGGRFTRLMRLYIAVGAFAVAYIVTVISVL